MLHGDALPGPERLADLAAEFSAGSGVPCEVAVTGDSGRDLGTDGRLTFYRVTQEALTNIRKHARADRVAIRLAYAAIWHQADHRGLRPVPPTPGRPLTGLATGSPA